jgi:hypothetical protein
MSLPRLTLAASLVIASLLAFLAPRGSTKAASETIPARELLTLAQRIDGTNYSFDRATSEALAKVTVQRPPEDASPAELESALREAGFELRPLGNVAKKVSLIERKGT